MKGLTDIPGILVGHATDAVALTGCTVVLCGADAVGGVDIRGSATGSCELDTLNPGHIAPNVHAIVLAGGYAINVQDTVTIHINTARVAKEVLEREGWGGVETQNA